MQRSTATTKNFFRKVLIQSSSQNNCHKSINNQKNFQTVLKPSSAIDIFINHRGIDTKRSISGLLYHHLLSIGFNPFLDSKNMKPGDRLFDTINPAAIRRCKVGVAVFSPRYCESYFCLHELALLMETKKRVIPIFCDVKPSQLRVVDDGSRSIEELQRFSDALEEAKFTVGLTFDTCQGNWSEFLTMATEAVIKNMIEVEEARAAVRSYKCIAQNHNFKKITK